MKITIHTTPALVVQCGDERWVCRDQVDVTNAVCDLLDGRGDVLPPLPPDEDYKPIEIG